MTELRNLYLTDPDDPTRQQEFDPLFKAPLSIDIAHHEIHEGDGFHVLAKDLAMADTDVLEIAFKTPAGTKLAHMVFDFGALIAGSLDLIEGASWTQGSGSALAIVNHKREAVLASSMLLENRVQPTFTASNEMIQAVTGISGGTTINLGCVFGSKQAGGGRDRGIAEWLMEPDQTYIVRFTADGNSNAGVIILDWYEHTSG